MTIIYCIEDINDFKYIGKTNQPINSRLSQHRADLRRKTNSSSKINLYNCIIYKLEECLEDLSKERERYWINKIDCVNEKKLNGVDIERKRKRCREYARQQRIDNPEHIRAINRKYYHNKKNL